MWYDVDQQIRAFKRDIWKRLVTLHTASRTDGTTGRIQDQHMELIGLLLELGADDNPIWLRSRCFVAGWPVTINRTPILSPRTFDP
ncbi:hypothetical protein LB505_001279 [Fusarium chuoi]|nr:hypothetical protein LB505_001279 [Fusarium chuoi]